MRNGLQKEVVDTTTGITVATAVTAEALTKNDQITAGRKMIKAVMRSGPIGAVLKKVEKEMAKSAHIATTTTKANVHTKRIPDQNRLEAMKKSPIKRRRTEHPIKRGTQKKLPYGLNENGWINNLRG